MIFRLPICQFLVGISQETVVFNDHPSWYVTAQS